MTQRRKDGKARTVLVLLVLLGIGLLVIPFLLTPPAALELALRDKVFSTDLQNRTARVTNDASGETLAATVQSTDGAFVARINRINSGSGSFTVALDGYEPVTVSVEAPPLQTVRAAVDLVPNFGRLELTVVNATRTAEPVAAKLKGGSTSIPPQPTGSYIIDLPPGEHRMSAEAAGFCSGNRDFEVAQGKVTKTTFPLSPDLRGNEVARLVLDWGDNPRDLDANFLKAGTPGYPDPNHVFFNHQNGRTASGDLFAVLDVDQRNSRGFETVTVYDEADGDFEYYVHLYAGSGTLGSSGAQVETFIRGCQRRHYRVPTDCAEDIWMVTNLRIHQGNVEFIDQNRCEIGRPLHSGGKTPEGPRGY
jgi:hypothetical protein